MIGLEGNRVKRVKVSYKKGNWPARMRSAGELMRTNLMKTPVEFTHASIELTYVRSPAFEGI